MQIHQIVHFKNRARNPTGLPPSLPSGKLGYNYSQPATHASQGYGTAPRYGGPGGAAQASSGQQASTPATGGQLGYPNQPPILVLLHQAKRRKGLPLNMGTLLHRHSLAMICSHHHWAHMDRMVMGSLRMLRSRLHLLRMDRHRLLRLVMGRMDTPTEYSTEVTTPTASQDQSTAGPAPTTTTAIPAPANSAPPPPQKNPLRIKLSAPASAAFWFPWRRHLKFKSARN
ncbi:hypothetical protein ZWY2020_058302 [Hordeum vulgare]|nr:hypothetical protein ZWY2020_058302 [Hordeum vulgare]